MEANSPLRRNLSCAELKKVASAAQKRFEVLKQKYPQMKGWLVFSSPDGQTDIDSSPVRVLAEFPEMVTDGALKNRVLDILRRTKFYEKDEKEKLEEEVKGLAEGLSFECSGRVEIRFHRLDFALISQLQRDELVDRALTPQSGASIRIVLVTVEALVGSDLEI